MPAQLVLVHSPLVGPGTWDLVAPALSVHGYQVLVPDLTGTVAAGPPYGSRQVEAIARIASGQPVVLVGHSGAGPLLVEAGTILDGVQGYIFVDAGLPIPGRSWMETVPTELAAHLREMVDPEGWLPPWSEWWGVDGLAELIPEPDARRRFTAGCPRLPLAMFEEVHPQAPGWHEIPAAYLRLSEGYADDASQARTLGWPVIERSSNHLGPLTDSGVVVDSLLQLLGRLVQQSG